MCRLIKRGIKLLISVNQSKKQQLYISDHFQKTALKFPNKAAIVFKDRQLTFREVDELSNRIANILRGAGLCHGNTAAVFTENSLEYLPVFLAMCKLGVTGMVICYSGIVNCSQFDLILYGWKIGGPPSQLTSKKLPIFLTCMMIPYQNKSTNTI